LAFPKLDSVGQVFSGLGRPDGSIRQDGRRKEYLYEPFHRFQIPFTYIVGEPLVFLREQVSDVHLFINPDLWMYLGLEERSLVGQIILGLRPRVETDAAGS
jgi:hypothetical protein